MDEPFNRVVMDDLETEEAVAGGAPPNLGEHRRAAMEREEQPGAAEDDVQEPAGAGQSGERVPIQRKLKLVLTLEPAAGDGCRVLLALGAEGCDPIFRSAEAQDFAAALDLVPALVAEGEARWRTRPRYPTARAAGKAKSTAPAARPAEASPATKAGGHGAAGAAEERGDPGGQPSTGQLPLF